MSSTRMPATGGHSEACCNTPPVVEKGYMQEGWWETIDGLRTYVTGPKDCTKGIIFITDVFGFFDQTKQGGDILGHLGRTKHLVFMPDWFDGNPMPVDWFPPTDPEKQKNLAGFFAKHTPQDVAARIPQYVKACEAKHPNVKSWAIHGLCWGAKVVSLLTGRDDNIFKVASECHPALLEPEDAKHIKIPIIVLASNYEDPLAVKQFEANLKVPKHVEIFADMVHGWMGARAEFDGGRKEAEYRRGYGLVLEFFEKHWE
ncbi:hypothetical protein VTK73DRAFT_9849 [Phialemonium thermophilum]|uniref:Dienelactone hydrolase domain-containing protein n=1 Tax=Phialemonium thermophilum TaxID=223376 RepID=A0ABR3VZT3_9PEZI